MKRLLITLSVILLALAFTGCASGLMSPIPNTDTYKPTTSAYQAPIISTILVTITSPASVTLNSTSIAITTATATTTVTTTKTVTATTTTLPPTTTHVLSLIQTFTGSGATNTQAFQITGNTWEIVWSVVAANQYNLMSYTVYQPGNSFPLDVGSGSTTSGNSYEYFGPGTYYINVTPANVTSWTIQVYG